MFHISLEDATKFWDYLEAELNNWEADTKLADQLSKRREGRLALDNFSLQWQAELDAKAIAIRELRDNLETARMGGEAYMGQPIAITMIDSVLSGVLIRNESTSFEAAQLVLNMANARKRQLLGNILRFSIKETA
jgi:hypothetical protein